MDTLIILTILSVAWAVAGTVYYFKNKTKITGKAEAVAADFVKADATKAEAAVIAEWKKH
jgi:hypothetical protein